MENESLDNSIEDIVLPEDIAVLRGEMYSQIRYAESLGVFTESEANQWKDGFEACTKISHMENLIDIIDDFVASGLAVISKIEDLLDNRLISETDKNRWRSTAETASFDEKQDIVEELKTIIKKVDSLKRKLITILTNKQAESNQVSALIKKFESSDIANKESVLDDAKKLETNNPQKQADQISVVKQNSRSKAQYEQAIANYIETRRFDTARNILEKGRQYFNFDEYSLISGSIDIKEIQTTQKNIKLAA